MNDNTFRRRASARPYWERLAVRDARRVARLRDVLAAGGDAALDHRRAAELSGLPEAFLRHRYPDLRVLLERTASAPHPLVPDL